jgi:hypothetical protein
MAWVDHNAICSAADGFPISVSRMKVWTPKILYLELSWTLTGIFALIGNHPRPPDEIGRIDLVLAGGV